MRFLVLLAFVVSAGFAHAGPKGNLDSASAAALAQTMQLLQRPDKRNEAIAKDPKAKVVDERVRSLAGSEENQQAIYEFAAEVFEHLIQQTDGDVALAMSKLQAGMSNPEAFAKSLPTPLQTKLKKLGARMPASQPKTTP